MAQGGASLGRRSKSTTIAAIPRSSWARTRSQGNQGVDLTGDEARGEQEKPERERAYIEGIAKDGVEVAKLVKDDAQGALEKPEHEGAAVKNIAKDVIEIAELTKDEAQGELEKPEREGADIEELAKQGLEVAVENVVRDVVGTRMPLFDTHIIVDWSARSKRSPAKPTKDAIWWAGARVDGSRVPALEPQYARSRHDALRCLVRLIADELKDGRRVLVGFDFPFGYPKGVAAHLTRQVSASALDLWDWLAERIEDAPNNANNRYKVATAINKAYPGYGPCWGRPASWSFPTIPEKKSARTGQERHPPERRIADQCAKGAKTVWQLAYAGSVGSQVLLGLPALKHLIEDPSIAGRAAVWPLLTGLRAPAVRVVIAEVYPSLLKEEVTERTHEGEILDRAQVRVNAEAFARLDAGGGLAPLFRGAPFLTPAQRRLIETEEAWILGLGHEEALKRAMPSP